MFKVKELFYSLQGEGHYAGTPSVFCRFAGCNMWSGREADRLKSACWFCDTDFVGGTTYDEDSLIIAITNLWPGGGAPRVIFTGGEPALQITQSLITRLKLLHFNVAVETNGTIPLPVAGSYWVTVSPKSASTILRKGHEIKLLWPNPLTPPEQYSDQDFEYFYLQPIDDCSYKENLRSAIDYCLANPQWRLSTQNHKIWGVR